MSNVTYLLTLSNEFYPINKDYYYAALQYEITMPIALLPNLYFLYFTLTEKVLKKRPSLKKNILTFTTLNITFIITNLLVSSVYLNGYFNQGLIRVKLCFYIRNIQLTLMTLLVTVPLVFTIDRYFTVFSNNDYQKYICFIVFLLSNFPSFTLVITTFINSNTVWVSDEICTFSKVSTINTINSIIFSIYYITLGIPFIVGIINFFLIRRLNTITVTSAFAKSNKNENKTVFINLIIQTLQPFVGQLPSILFFFYFGLTQNNIYLVWRILDGLSTLSLVLNVLFSIIFIKEVRNAVFRRLSINTINDKKNIVTITNNNMLKSKKNIIK
uniref:G-protein coupled receptors family 1 profile domain-containing protein n=1 Tax=Strongyloides stercoralis TaxID=6248 RepID=A0A0K0E9V6_STRER